MSLEITARTIVTMARMSTDVPPMAEMSTCRPTLRKKNDRRNVVIESTFSSRPHSLAWSANIIPARNAPMIAASPMTSAKADMARQTMMDTANMLTAMRFLPPDAALRAAMRS